MEAPPGSQVKVTHRLWFGEQACEIEVARTGQVYVAVPKRLRRLRGVVASRNLDVEIMDTTQQAAIERACSYLEQRFGSRGPTILNGEL